MFKKIVGFRENKHFLNLLLDVVFEILLKDYKVNYSFYVISYNNKLNCLFFIKKEKSYSVDFFKDRNNIQVSVSEFINNRKTNSKFRIKRI